MMGEPIAMLCWGAMFGWFVARWRVAVARPATINASLATREHEIGVRMVSIMRELIETQRFARRFTGAAMPTEKRWSTPSRFGTIEVVVTLHDDGPA